MGSKGIVSGVCTVIIVALGVAYNGCDNFSFRKQKGPVIARVNKSVLTLEDLNNTIPSEASGRITPKQKISFVKQWIDDEILYQAALKKKIDREKKVKAQLEKMRKHFLISEMISRYTNYGAGQSISEEMIVRYFQTNKDSFIRESDVVKFVDIVVNDMKEGWRIRNMVTPENFFEIGSQYSTVPLGEPNTISYVSVKSVSPEMAAVVPTIKQKGITNPLQMSDGIHIIFLIDKQKAGEVCTLEEVHNEIMQTLLTESQKKDMEKLLADLKQKANYEYHLELLQEQRQTDTGDDTITVYDTVAPSKDTTITIQPAHK